MTLAPLPLATVRAALAAHGAAPRKRHGQHFLHDDNLLAAIVRDGAVGPDDTVLEIGPGPGLLTRHLLATGAAVVAVEIDPALTAVARQLVEPELARRLEWIEEDVLGPGRSLSARAEAALARATRLVSNLPYNVAGPVLGRVVPRGRGPGRIAVMVQREMARRVVARPGERDYGPLAVLATLWTAARVARRVPSGAFWPVPAVESAVLVLDRLGSVPGEGDRAALDAFLPLAFHARRKTLVNSLAAATGRAPQDVATRLGVEEKVGKLRAETFDALELLDLARHWAEHAPGELDRPDPR